MVGSGDDQVLVLNTWHEWEIEAGARRIVLCVETPLELRPGHEGFDPPRLEALLDEATKLMRDSPSPIDLVRIVQSKPE